MMTIFLVFLFLSFCSFCSIKALPANTISYGNANSADECLKYTNCDGGTKLNLNENFSSIKQELIKFAMANVPKDDAAGEKLVKNTFHPGFLNKMFGMMAFYNEYKKFDDEVMKNKTISNARKIYASREAYKAIKPSLEKAAKEALLGFFNKTDEYNKHVQDYGKNFKGSLNIKDASFREKNTWNHMDGLFDVLKRKSDIPKAELDKIGVEFKTKYEAVISENKGSVPMICNWAENKCYKKTNKLKNIK